MLQTAICSRCKEQSVDSYKTYSLNSVAHLINPLTFIVMPALAFAWHATLAFPPPGVAGTVASVVFNPMALSVGASGAIFGLCGALWLFF